jgi:hypothetical protein
MLNKTVPAGQGLTKEMRPEKGAYGMLLIFFQLSCPESPDTTQSIGEAPISREMTPTYGPATSVINALMPAGDLHDYVSDAIT